MVERVGLLLKEIQRRKKIQLIISITEINIRNKNTTRNIEALRQGKHIYQSQVCAQKYFSAGQSQISIRQGEYIFYLLSTNITFISGPIKLINYAPNPQVLQVKGDIRDSYMRDDIYRSMLRIHGNEDPPQRLSIQRHIPIAMPQRIPDRIIRGKQNLYSIYEGNSVIYPNCSFNISYASNDRAKEIHEYTYH